MEPSASYDLPKRVTDIIHLKQEGIPVDCQTSFEILPVDFVHRATPFQAYIFLCRWTGKVDGKDFKFRKCYARGCPHNLCPHVYQAIMIANRYLHRDYRRLETAGVEIKKKLFTLEDMTVKFEDIQEEYRPTLSIHDYITIAEEGNKVSIAVDLEYVSAVEHFANYKSSHMFLMVDFAITSLGETHHHERCLACYPAEKESEEKDNATGIANERLKILYKEFDDACIMYDRMFFE
jgi:hypothetical protein